jgi:hypothetical protein
MLSFHGLRRDSGIGNTSGRGLFTLTSILSREGKEHSPSPWPSPRRGEEIKELGFHRERKPERKEALIG